MTAEGARGAGAYMDPTPSTPIDPQNSVYAAYGELQAPVTDTIKVQLAARFEDYGGQTGSTFDPKVSVRWQIVPMFALRGSIKLGGLNATIDYWNIGIGKGIVSDPPTPMVTMFGAAVNGCAPSAGLGSLRRRRRLVELF